MGWAFKANTNDSRESAAIYITKKLIEAGASVNIYDPMVSEERIFKDLTFVFKDPLPKDKIKISTEFISIIKSSNALSIITEWDEFKNFNWENYLDKSNSQIKIFDGRNILGSQLKDYKNYYSI